MNTPSNDFDYATLGYTINEIDMLRDATQAVNTTDGGWTILREFNDPKGFSWTQQPDVRKIDRNIKYEGHSGTSHAWVMRTMQEIAITGLDKFSEKVLEYRRTAKPRPLRTGDDLWRFIAENENIGDASYEFFMGLKFSSRDSERFAGFVKAALWHPYAMERLFDPDEKDVDHVLLSEIQASRESLGGSGGSDTEEYRIVQYLVRHGLAAFTADATRWNKLNEEEARESRMRYFRIALKRRDLRNQRQNLQSCVFDEAIAQRLGSTWRHFDGILEHPELEAAVEYAMTCVLRANMSKGK